MSSGTVVVVENDADLQEMIRITLSDLHVGVICASDGREALSYLADSERPDLILLDFQMPNMDGFEFRALQLRDARLRHVPVVFMTAIHQIPEQKDTLKSVHCLKKPFAPDELLAVVRSYISNPRGTTMDAIEMLKSQHREVKALFGKFEKLGEKASVRKQDVFEEIADALAMHAAIEEKHFYPAVKAKRTEDILLEALEEHLGIKRVIADLLKVDSSDETFDAKVKVLKEQVEHHVEEEESDLFPKVRKLLDKAELTEIAETMQETMADLEEKGNARLAVPSETRAAPTL